MIDTTSLMTVPYGSAVATQLSFERAVETVKSLLKEQGFGVLCEIDVAAAMREKLGVEFRPYRILGACNPQLAHQALSAQPQLGLLLPCNVVVQEAGGKTIVSAIDADAMLRVTGANLEHLAAEVNARLARVLENVQKAQV